MSLITDPRQIIIESDAEADADAAGGVAADRMPRAARKAAARRPDAAALSRLIAPTAASTARAQRKFSERAGGAAARRPISVSKTATRAGERLYACATSQRRHLERLRESRAADLLSREEKFTFCPAITATARELGAAGYRPPHARYADTRAKQERTKLQRAMERDVRSAAGCTFHPIVAPASARMARAQRRHSEPFFSPGDRLFVDGGRRLIRQQLRQRIVEEKEAQCVVGGFELSAEAAGAVAARLRNWGEARDRRVESARESFFSDKTRRAASAPRERMADETFSYFRQRYGERQQQHTDAMDKQACPPRRRMSQRRTSETEVTKDNVRALLYRALFVKYASSNRAPTLSLREVKRQVRELFPADSGLVAALATDFDEDTAIDRDAFVASLSRFVARHGPQPWAELSALGRRQTGKENQKKKEEDVRSASVVLSSSTEDAEADEVAAELEALLDSPEKRSKTASPTRSPSPLSPRHYSADKVMREARELIAVRDA